MPAAPASPIRPRHRPGAGGFRATDRPMKAQAQVRAGGLFALLCVQGGRALPGCLGPQRPCWPALGLQRRAGLRPWAGAGASPPPSKATQGHRQPWRCRRAWVAWRFSAEAATLPAAVVAADASLQFFQLCQVAFKLFGAVILGGGLFFRHELVFDFGGGSPFGERELVGGRGGRRGIFYLCLHFARGAALGLADLGLGGAFGQFAAIGVEILALCGDRFAALLWRWCFGLVRR